MKKRTSNAIAVSVLSIFVAFMMLTSFIPYLALLLASMLPPGSVTTTGISVSHVLKYEMSLRNYKSIFYEASSLYIPYFLNTIVVSAIASLLATIVAAFGAYGLTRFYSKSTAQKVRRYVLYGYVFPPIVLVLPYTRLFSFLHIIDTRMGLVVAHLAFCLPFALWLSLRYFDAVPRQYDRTAALDGAYWWSALRRVILPQALPGVLTVCLLVFIVSWNDVALSQYLIQSQLRQTVGVAFQKALWSPDSTADWESLCAAGVILVVPLAFLLFLMSVVTYRQRRRVLEAL